MKHWPYFVLGLVFVGCQSHEKQPDSFPTPNVVLIMADDMGFSDLGCYGGEIETPNIDVLAASGVKCSQFYNSGRCCPSRASLLTGKYAHAVDMGWMNAIDMQRKGYRGSISKEFPTMAENFAQGGYTTFMVGKWHLMATDSVRAGTGSNWPTDRGFKEYYGTLEGAKDYFKPEYLYRNKQKAAPTPPYFYTHAIIDTAVSFIKKNTLKPFFLYTAFYVPHFPLQAPEETVKKYLGKYKEGWQALREDRLKKQKTLGLQSQRIPLSEKDTTFPDWNSLGAKKQDEMDRRMAIYAAQIEELDKGVGKLLKTLKKIGEYENTIIVFLSDNGAEGSVPLGRGEEKNLNRSGPYTSYGRAWANASNTPYRKYKSYAHEGGIIAPLIISWPARIRPRKTFLKQTVHIIDLMTTLGSLARVKTGNTDGMDVSTWFLNDSLKTKERKLFWEHEGKRAVRMGDWKLVSPGIDKPWELYDLKKDPIEETNLVDTFPEKAESLEREWAEWAKTNNVLPMDGSEWNARLTEFKKKDLIQKGSEE